MNKKFITLFIAFFVIVSGSAFLFKDDISNLYSKLLLRLPKIEKGFNDLVVQEIKKQVFTPPPLRSDSQEEQSFLTRLGVIKFTNIERVKAGLSPLKENAGLDISSSIKAKDLLDKQYFAHESPSGIGVADLAERAGYGFILIGENLALGNFKDDQALVQAWMDSPGHRANILNTKYKDIGVSVIKGMFEGRTTWFAVQHFGFSSSACPEPSQSLKNQISIERNQAQEFQVILDSLRIEIESSGFKRRDYNQKVQQYNDLVSQYNNLNVEIEILLDQYNNQVLVFNNCAGL
ncbi:MAG: CAP domain-containing protein [Patescibacteria group bacterium]